MLPPAGCPSCQSESPGGSSFPCLALGTSPPTELGGPGRAKLAMLSPMRSRPSSQRRALPPLPSPPLSRRSGDSPQLSPGIGRSLSHPELGARPGLNVGAEALFLRPPLRQLAGGRLDPAEQKAVCERMAAMLSDLQQQYAKKLNMLMQPLQDAAQASAAAPGRLDAPSRPGTAAQGQVLAGPAGPGDTEVGGPTSGADAKGGSRVDAGDVTKLPAPEPSTEGGSGVLPTAEVWRSSSSLQGTAEDTRPAETDGGDASSLESAAEEDAPSEVDGTGRVAATAGHMVGNRQAVHGGRSVADLDAEADAPSPVKEPKTRFAAGAAAKKAPKKKAKKKAEGIQCIKTITFQGNAAQPVRCAVASGDEVWTADWSGRLFVRDRENVDKVKCDLQSDALVWCMALIEGGQAPMVWVGRERAGIPVFHAATKELLCTLTGGHSGNVLAFAVADGPDGRIDVYSAGNDFSIRCWHVEQGKGKSAGTVALPGVAGTQIRRGVVLYWHKNGVRCLLRIGPTLWSGGDDKAICLWKCADGERVEAVEDAHEAGVICMVIAGRGVWSSGYDGRVKEWTIGGAARECTREIKFDEPLRALCPVGDHVWVCGQSRNIFVYSSDMSPIDALEGHASFVSSLILVDRVETRLLWSSSLADRSLRVWKHILRGGSASVAELAAANKLYEERQWAGDERFKQADAAAEAARGELAAASVEFAKQLEEVMMRAANAELERDLMEAAKARAIDLEAAARRAEREAKAKMAELSEELHAALAARRAAEEDAAAQMRAAQAAETLAEQARAARAAALQAAAEAAASLAAEQARAAELQRQLGAASGRADESEHGAKGLRLELLACEAQRASARASLEEEQGQRRQLEALVEALRGQVAQLEHERDESRAREKHMEQRYAELDVFKLDVIARELKSIDRQIDSLLFESKSLQQAAKKFSNYGDANTSAKAASILADASAKLRGIVRDVIERCLSETQKLHVGAAIQDAKAAGVLKDGGGMKYIIAEGVHLDEESGGVKRERRQPK